MPIVLQYLTCSITIVGDTETHVVTSSCTYVDQHGRSRERGRRCELRLELGHGQESYT